jgi:hypothetical protein
MVLVDEDDMEPDWVTISLLEKVPGDGLGSPDVDGTPGAGNADPDVEEMLGTGGAEPNVDEIFGNSVEVLLPTFEGDSDGLTVPVVNGGADKGG